MEKRVQAFLKLRDFLSDFLGERKNNSSKAKYEQLDELIKETYSYNGWFTDDFVKKALYGIIQLIEPTNLKEFIKEIKEPKTPKTIAVIMAGNITAVRFYAFLLCLFLG